MNVIARRLLLSISALALLPIHHASAGPTAIRDDRVTDLAITPVLGRGYSIATSTYQSICLQNIVKTKPSYNFTYRFEQLQEDGSRSATVSSSSSAGGGGTFYGISVDAKASSGSSAGTTSTEKVFRIIVSITMDMYYASVDESYTRLSDTARELLQKKDIPGFFDSCGPYYIRSLGRFSKFAALLSYTSQTTQRDAKFEAALEASIKAMDYGGSTATSTSSELKESMARNKLTIDVAAWGLGKDREAKLLSTDIESFKAAIKDAFLAMQDEDTGMVTSMEVVPWVENTEFQRYIDLKEGDDGVPLYMQKRILNQNGEFLAEVDRALRNKLNIYYKAKLCQIRVARDFRENGDINGTLLPEYAQREVINNRFPNREPMKLEELSKQLEVSAVNALRDNYQNLLNGGAKTGGGGAGGGGQAGGQAQAGALKGAVGCIKAMSEQDLAKTSYRDVKPCTDIETELADLQGQFVNDYCMPRLK